MEQKILNTYKDHLLLHTFLFVINLILEFLWLILYELKLRFYNYLKAVLLLLVKYKYTRETDS